MFQVTLLKSEKNLLLRFSHHFPILEPPVGHMILYMTLKVFISHLCNVKMKEKFKNLTIQWDYRNFKI